MRGNMTLFDKIQSGKLDLKEPSWMVKEREKARAKRNPERLRKLARQRRKLRDEGFIRDKTEGGV